MNYFRKLRKSIAHKIYIPKSSRDKGVVVKTTDDDILITIDEKNKLKKELNELCYLYHDLIKQSNIDEMQVKAERWESYRDKLIDKILNDES